MGENSLDKLTELFRNEKETVAVALSGSRTSAINDTSSDYDLYIYRRGHITPERRTELYRTLTDDYRVNASLFEEGDEVHIDGIAYDVMFRTPEWTADQINDVWLKHNARLGYTTCFIYNFRTSELLFDRDGEIASLFKQAETTYPEELRKNIIEKNLYIIEAETEAPFIRQLELAVKRDDIVSQNHRTAAILASYFDILFAYNRVLHPGEKKLEKYVHLLCKDIPENFDKDIRRVCSSTGEELLSAIRELMDNLHKLID